MCTPKLLFILKQGTVYGTTSYGSMSYGSALENNGLYNSARFVVDMLNDAGVSATLVQVVDSDSIDAEIKKYAPTHVILEALWVEPKNLQAVVDVNPGVAFLVRIHSETAFLVQETIAIAWIAAYLQMGVSVGFNSYRTAQIMMNLYPGLPVLFSPDYFPVANVPTIIPALGDSIEIGCFGALRLMKNQLNQGIAAIQFGREKRKPVNFHINTSFHGDTNGGAILANLRALFAGTESTLVEHPWHTEAEFTALLLQMDLVMQVSLSESFNLVAAEATSLRIPIVVSHEVSWAGPHVRTIPTSVVYIVETMRKAINSKSHVHANVQGLREYDEASKKIWLAYVGS